MKPSKIKFGILGGGQLGKMLIQAALNFDLDLKVIDPDPNAACSFHKNFILGDFKNFDQVYEFGKDCHYLTIEIENVNVEALKKLEAEGVNVFPQASVIEIIQDKGLQKEFLKQNKIPTADFKLISSMQELSKIDYPKILKLRKGGYDGRGVIKLKSNSDLTEAFNAPCVLEDLINIKKEISIIVARSKTGELKCFPAVEMIIDPNANLVDFLACPAELTQQEINLAEKIACDTATALGIVGLLAVEMFVDLNGNILVNELAPRPHNSGHHTIEACQTSQYEQLIRGILNLPLGSTDILQSAVMINILGEQAYSGTADYQGLEQLLAIPGANIHLYGKQETRPYRKMGHITILNKDLTKALEQAKLVKKFFKVQT